MDIETRRIDKFYELIPQGDNLSALGTVINKKRILVGRSDNCDLIIKKNDISAIHAVIEVGPSGGRVYDMNSIQGTYVNGTRLVCSELSVGDKVQFGKQTFIFKDYDKADVLPPILDALSPETISTFDTEVKAAKVLPETPDFVKKTAEFKINPQNIKTEESGEGTPYVAYPLAKDPKAEFSEYIFEDADDVYPIFKWDIDHGAVEVIIIYNDRIFSIDYIPQKDGIYKIVGSSEKESEIEYPYLMKNESIPFLEVRGGQVVVLDSLGYNGMIISDEIKDPKDFQEKKVSTPIILDYQDILKLQNNHLQIFVRNTSAPPKIKPAPIFRRDNDSRKYFLILSMIAFMFLGFFSTLEVNEEIEKDKLPERVATILYDRKKFTYKPRVSQIKKEKKTPRTPKQPKKLKKQVAPKQPKVADAPKKINNQKRKKTARPTKRPSKTPPKKGSNPSKRIAKKNTAKKLGTGKRTKQTARRRTTRVAKSQGRVDAYRPTNFAGKLNALLAKGGDSKGVKDQQLSANDIGSVGTTVGGQNVDVQTASVSKNVGSLEGAATGKLNVEKGAEGLVNKKTIAAAGIPSRTVVLGDYDASLVAQILRDHLPQFQYCYQQELDRKEQKVSGWINMNFTIGASGHVTKAGVGKSDLSATVSKCVVNVLKGIKFPPPLGGGSVGIRQPFYFEPRTI